MYDDDDYDDDFRDCLEAARNLPCPTCGAPNRLTLADRARGYQCDACADQAEGNYRTVIYNETGRAMATKEHETQDDAWKSAADVLTAPLFHGCTVQLYGPRDGDARPLLVTIRGEQVQA